MGELYEIFTAYVYMASLLTVLRPRFGQDALGTVQHWKTNGNRTIMLTKTITDMQKLSRLGL